MKRKKTAKIESVNVVHDDKWVIAEQVVVTCPDGKELPSPYLFITIKNGGCSMVATRLVDGRFLMVRQWKPAAGISVEFPAGCRKQDESWEDAARRKAKEEAGCECGTLKEMSGQFMYMTNRLNGICHLYLAFDCTVTDEQTQENGAQEMERLLLSQTEVELAIKAGEIKDMATVLGFYAHLIHQ